MIAEFKEKYEEIALRKREELEKSLEDNQVADPISGTILATVLISSALAATSYLLSAALAPKPPRQQLGKLSGSLQLMNSEQGIMIPEIYGAGPTTSFVAGSNPTYTDIANCTQGADGEFLKTSGGAAWNAGGRHDTAINGDAFFKITVLAGYAGAGFGTGTTYTNSNTDFLVGIQWNPDSSITLRYNGTLLEAGIATWAAGDEFTLEIRSGRFRIYKGAAEIVPETALPTPTYPLYFGVAIQNVGSGLSASKIQIGSIGPPPNYGVGGMKVPAIIPWTSGIRKVTTVTTVGGGKGFGGGGEQEVENISYNLDIACKFAAEGPHRLIREYANADVLIDQMDQSLLPTGVYDATVGADATYDPLLPPDPKLNYQLAIDRLDDDINFDPDGTGGGVIQGGGSGFTVYTGTATQQPDPIIEADVDGRYGAGSTPAWRNHSYIVHQTLSLSRWGGVVPNITAVWEHETLKTLDDIYGALCERVNVKAANSDYDFSGLSTIASRGMLIAGRLFSPAEIIGSPEIQTVYNYFVTEAEGQLVGYVEGAEPSVTIPDTEVGWMDADAEPTDILPEIETFMASEIELPRQIDVKYVDPEKDWDTNTQSDNRQITEGVSTELLEVQLCLLADEARAAAQRKLYQGYVAGTAHKFTLPWTYLYLYPGYKITITRAEGFTHVMKLTSISGGIGILECEGIALEPAAFTQPAIGAGGPSWIPPLPIPAMTILGLLDTPILRDGDGGAHIGRYIYGLPRTGVKQKWTGCVFNISRNNQWVPIAESKVSATAGTVVSAVSLSGDPNTVDNTGVITVDLYGTEKFLTSVTEAEMIAGANLAVAGDMVFRFATATQLPNTDGTTPNRWELSDLLNGQRGTDEHITDDFVGARFVLIDSAVKFARMEYSDLNTLRSYKAVTFGQSLADAATVTNVWTGQTFKGLRPTSISVYHDAYTSGSSAAGNVQFFVPGSSTPAEGETLTYAVDAYPVEPDGEIVIDVSTNVFTATSHGLTASDTIALSTDGVLPKPLRISHHYFLRDITTHTFKLARTEGGDAIDVYGVQAGTHYFSRRLRHMPVVRGMVNPAVIDDNTDTVTTPGSGGWLETVSSAYWGRNDFNASYTVTLNSQTFGEISAPSFVVEFSINDPVKLSGNMVAVTFGSPSAGSDEGTNAYHQMHFTLVTSLPAEYGIDACRWQLRIKESGIGTATTVFTETDYEMPDTRYRMEIVGSVVKYYRNYAGAGSVPIYEGVIPVEYPKRLDVQMAGSAGMLVDIETAGRPEFVATYLAEEQIEDSGITPPPAFRYRVYEQRSFQGVTYDGDATDFIPFVPALVNWALVGSTITASSEYTAGGYNMVASNAADGDRTGAPTSPGVPTTLNIWHSANSTPDHWLEVNFNTTRSIEMIDVIGVQDNLVNPGEPTLSTTGTLYHNTAFDVEYWNGSSWVIVTGGTVTGNNLIWKQFIFTPVSTIKIRVLIHSSVDNFGRLTEVQVWGY